MAHLAHQLELAGLDAIKDESHLTEFESMIIIIFLISYRYPKLFGEIYDLEI